MSVTTKKALPEANGDFYAIGATISEEDQVLLRRTRAFRSRGPAAAPGQEGGPRPARGVPSIQSMTGWPSFRPPRRSEMYSVATMK